jgi:hypothetical protein
MSFTFKEFVMGAVVMTMCLAFLGLIGLAYAGKIDPAPIVTFVLTSVTALVAAAVTYISTTQKGKVEESMAYMRGRSDNKAEYTAAFQRYGSMDYTEMVKGQAR